MNSTAIIGRLGRCYYYPDDKPRATFFVEVEGGGRYPDRIKCCAWGGLAEKVNGLAEGDLVLAAGRLQSRNYTKGEVKVWTLEVVATSVRLLGSFVEEQDQPKRERSPTPDGNVADPGFSDDNIPS